MHRRAWASEFIGTTILLFVEVIVVRLLFEPDSAIAQRVPGLPARLALIGLVTAALLALLIVSPIGQSSGGHFNPAVTVTLWLVRGLPGRDAVAFVLAQLLGSVAGVLLARAALGSVVAHPHVNYAVIQPARGWSDVSVFIGEAVSITVLMTAVMLFLTRPAMVRWTPAVVAIAVGVLIVVGGLTSGGCFNPARQLGPALLARQWEHLWAYLIGPVAGSVIVGTVFRMTGRERPITCGLCGHPPADLPPAGSRR
ncbi:aquaporin [Dactylosporangium sp. NPDC049140]|uniref:MIP/aquaporin family protein n=1 Tax=Dactylosporangium sp. NPDC049140 TaxID=3155647 RepID=UPI0033EDFDFB